MGRGAGGVEKYEHMRKSARTPEELIERCASRQAGDERCVISSCRTSAWTRCPVPSHCPSSCRLS